MFLLRIFFYRIMNLLIDIGNSQVKIATAVPDNESVKLLKRFPYSKSNFEHDFENSFPESKIKSFNKAGISILQDGNEKYLTKFFKNHFDIKPVFINRKCELPFKISYSKELGNDRICNAAAAVSIFKRKKLLIIDFGTATTYTLIINEILSGGLISPGIKTSLDSLIEKTSLPEVRLIFPKNLINKDTINNIRSGVLYQSLYSVERIITELRKKFNDLFVVATGGYSSLIYARTNLINIIDKNLVLKGINKIISL